MIDDREVKSGNCARGRGAGQHALVLNALAATACPHHKYKTLDSTSAAKRQRKVIIVEEAERILTPLPSNTSNRRWPYSHYHTVQMRKPETNCDQELRAAYSLIALQSIPWAYVLDGCLPRSAINCCCYGVEQEQGSSSTQTSVPIYCFHNLSPFKGCPPSGSTVVMYCKTGFVRPSNRSRDSLQIVQNSRRLLLSS